MADISIGFEDDGAILETIQLTTACGGKEGESIISTIDLGQQPMIIDVRQEALTALVTRLPVCVTQALQDLA